MEYIDFDFAGYPENFIEQLCLKFPNIQWTEGYKEHDTGGYIALYVPYEQVEEAEWIIGEIEEQGIENVKNIAIDIPSDAEALYLLSKNFFRAIEDLKPVNSEEGMILMVKKVLPFISEVYCLTLKLYSTDIPDYIETDFNIEGLRPLDIIDKEFDVINYRFNEVMRVQNLSHFISEVCSQLHEGVNYYEKGTIRSKAKAILAWRNLFLDNDKFDWGNYLLAHVSAMHKILSSQQIPARMKRFNFSEINPNKMVWKDKCYQTCFEGRSLTESYKDLMSFLNKNGYEDVPVPKDINELTTFLKTGELYDGAYKSLPIKINLSAYHEHALDLTLFNEKNPNLMKDFHESIK